MEKRRGPKVKNAARDSAIRESFAGGASVSGLAAQYGITRQRVALILATAGLYKESGGQHRARVAAREAKERAFEERYGLTRPQYLQVPAVLRKAFAAHRNNAVRRGIPFELRLREWLEVWMSSGKLHLRGLGRGKYHMTRPGDVGPYSIGNAVIAEHGENSRECRSHSPPPPPDSWRTNFKRKVTVEKQQQSR